MNPIIERFRTTGQSFLFHDTKEDCKRLANYCNMLADKINELNLEVQELKKKLKEVNK